MEAKVVVSFGATSVMRLKSIGKIDFVHGMKTFNIPLNMLESFFIPKEFYKCSGL
jgi:hypothetical protein